RRHTSYWRDWSSDVCSSDLLSTLRATPHDVSRKTEGQDGVAVSFLVGLFHSLQHAGLTRRSLVNAVTGEVPQGDIRPISTSPVMRQTRQLHWNRNLPIQHDVY